MRKRSVPAASARKHASGFVPCAPELAYCTDCQTNRSNQQCPRQSRNHTQGGQLDRQPPKPA